MLYCTITVVTLFKDRNKYELRLSSQIMKSKISVLEFQTSRTTEENIKVCEKYEKHAKKNTRKMIV